MTLTIKELTVDEELGAFIAREIEAGHFTSESEIVEAALREMMANAGAEKLWRRIEASRRQAERGETIPAAEVFERLNRRIEEKAASQTD